MKNLSLVEKRAEILRVLLLISPNLKNNNVCIQYSNQGRVYVRLKEQNTLKSLQ